MHYPNLKLIQSRFLRQAGPFNNINGAAADNLFIICTLGLRQLKRRFSVLWFLIWNYSPDLHHACIILRINVCCFIHCLQCLFVWSWEQKIGGFQVWNEDVAQLDRGISRETARQVAKGDLLQFFPLIWNCSIRTSQSAMPSKSKGGTMGLSVVCILGCSSMKIIGLGTCGATPGSTHLLGTAGWELCWELGVDGPTTGTLRQERPPFTSRINGWSGAFPSTPPLEELP